MPRSELLSLPRTPLRAELLESATTVSACVHCGAALSAIRRERGDSFCCRGCETVHGLLQGTRRFCPLEVGSGRESKWSSQKPWFRVGTEEWSSKS